MKNNFPKTFGLLARFPDPESLVRAAEQFSQAGYRHMDAYAPFPVEGLSDALRCKASKVPLAVLAGGIIGGVLGYFMQYFATVIHLPINIGGRPHDSFLAYIPITFELTILLAAFGGVFALFLATGFPQPYHPVFNVEDFQKHGSQDGFYLGVEARDPKYETVETRKLLRNLGATQISEIKA